MLKILIADDEYRICQLIQALIDWQALPLTLVGLASNGRQAFELVEKERPDIVVTDIRMPGLDGLDLVRMTKEANLSCRFIIISGYRNFEYAHNALKYDVEDYLLKPISQEELNATLARVCATIEKELQSKKESIQANIQLSQSRDSLRRHFITGVVLGASFPAELEQINQEYSLCLSDGAFQAYFVKMDMANGIYPETQSNKALKKIQDMCERSFAQVCRESVCATTHSGVMAIVNYSAAERAQLRKQVQALFEEARQFASIFANFAVTIGAGVPVADISEISRSSISAIDCVKCRILCGTGRMIEAEQLHFQVNTLETLYGQPQQQALLRLFEALDAQGYQMFLAELIGKFHQDINPALLFQLCEQILSLFCEVARKNALELEDEQMLCNSISMQLDYAQSVQAVSEAIGAPIAELLQKNAQIRHARGIRPVSEAKKYIEAHYAAPLRLEDAAEAACLSPAYLSAMFKKETGINFLDYLTKYRMEKAKELLRRSADSIAQVGEAVGYPDAKYFSKLFTKTVGLKPSAYRKLYG